VFCDGYGVRWGARLAGLTIPHRMSPPDWIDDFAARAAAADQSVFALGDEPEVAASFQAKLAEARPGYRVAGSHDGFFEKQRAANDAVVDLINASGATHLLVGFGMPLQEQWLAANAHRLLVKTVIPVGALFRWPAGIDRGDGSTALLLEPLELLERLAALVPPPRAPRPAGRMAIRDRGAAHACRHDPGRPGRGRTIPATVDGGPPAPPGVRV
jgi:exopolysaccharide biosynthesis WecB/TagA/CpsF family protein